LAIGLDRDFIDESSPKELKPYVKAYKIQQKERDADNWRLGIYFMQAMTVCFNFSKEERKYFDRPLIEDMEYKQSPQYRIDLQKQLMATLETMQKNFERSKKNGN